MLHKGGTLDLGKNGYNPQNSQKQGPTPLFTV